MRRAPEGPEGREGGESPGPDIQMDTKWGPSLLAKLVNITPISLWFMVYMTIINGGDKPTYSWGPHLA